MTSFARSWRREPLVHFLLIGAALWAVSSFVGDDASAPRDDEVVVTAGRIEQLATIYVKTRGRLPDRAELEGLVDDWIREELAYREAQRMGLDEDDTIVRRRMRQKLEFLFEDLSGQLEPTEEELAGYLAANPDRFRADARFDFEHVYVSEDRRDDPRGDAERLLAELRAGTAGDPALLGDRLLVDARFTDLPAREVRALFGNGFAASLDEVEAGDWTGPIASGYGLHLVRVSRRVDGALPALDAVRADVEREWRNDVRVRALDDAYAALLERYDVTVQWPEPDPEPGDTGDEAP